MAKYYMVAFQDLDALAVAGTSLGPALDMTIMLQDDDIRPFPPLQQDFEAATSEQEDNPAPVPIAISGMIVGYFIGKYYDEWAVGVTSKPAVIPPHSTACIISSSDFSTLRATNGCALAYDLKLFQQNNQPISKPIVRPVFVNDTDQKFALHILRASPFVKDHSSQLIDNGAFGPTLPQGYDSPRFASLCID
jgi:hypothetical protein